MARPRRRSRTGLAVGVSALVHAALLFGLSRVIPLPEPAFFARPDIQIDLVTDLGRAAGGLATARATHLARSLLAPAPPLPASLDRRSTASVNRPAPVAAPPRAPATGGAGATPRPAANVAAPAAGVRGPGAPSRPGPTGSGERHAEAVDGDGVRSVLRTTVGCSHVDYLKLTPAERAVCARQFGRQASIGARQTVDPISMKKRDYFDAVKQAYDDARNYPTPLDDDPEHSASGPGHGPSVGCIHGKCGIISPQGTLTEESGVSPP